MVRLGKKWTRINVKYTLSELLNLKFSLYLKTSVNPADISDVDETQIENSFEYYE